MLPIRGRDLLSKREIKKVLFTAILGFIVAILVVAIISPEKRKLGILICIAFTALTYFGISNKLFKK
jgi:hypothetical protein